MSLVLNNSVTPTTTNLSATCTYELPDYVHYSMSNNVSIHTANSVSVIIGVVAGVVTIILTPIVILSLLCFFKIKRHNKLGKVLLFSVA